jgi:hypothetical protein
MPRSARSAALLVRQILPVVGEPAEGHLALQHLVDCFFHVVIRLRMVTPSGVGHPIDTDWLFPLGPMGIDFQR